MNTFDSSLWVGANRIMIIFNLLLFLAVMISIGLMLGKLLKDKLLSKNAPTQPVQKMGVSDKEIILIQGLGKADYIKNIQDNLSTLFLGYFSSVITERLLRYLIKVGERGTDKNYFEDFLNVEKKAGIITTFISSLSPIMRKSIDTIYNSRTDLVNYLNNIYEMYIRIMAERQQYIAKQVATDRARLDHGQTDLSVNDLDAIHDNKIYLDTLIRMCQKDMIGYNNAHIYMYDIGEFPYTNF